jgi:integrase
MASYRQRSNGTVEAVVKRVGLLPKPVSMTFDTIDDAKRVCARIEALLDQGIVPPDLQKEVRDEISSLGGLIREYMRAVEITPDDEAQLTKIVLADGGMSLAKLTYDWVEAWINTMKREKNLSPSTIRKYVGALARACDWGANKGIAAVLTHPMRRLPRGYATYTREDDRILAAQGKIIKEDTERDRRLLKAEELRIEGILAGEKPEGRQRALRPDLREAKLDLFHLALDSCMRMREMVTLTVDQVDFEAQALLLERTKNGDKRVVPIMTDRMEAVLRRRCASALPDGRLFPWWDGVIDLKSFRAASNLVSHQYATIFDLAGCGDFIFHDLRHEAISRLFEKTELSDTEIARISGHRDPRQLRRYTHLRPSAVVAKVRNLRKTLG